MTEAQRTTIIRDPAGDAVEDPNRTGEFALFELPLRFCCECRWGRLGWGLFGRTMRPDYCTHPHSGVDAMVRRGAVGALCATSRQNWSRCGPNGRLWEARDG